MIGIPVVLLSFILFLAMVLNLALKPKSSVQLTKWCMLFAVAIGTVFYGVGYAQLASGWFAAIIQTVFSVIGMFLGKYDFSGLGKTALLSSQFTTDLFWLSHLAAFYTTASACMITIGSELLRRLRLLLSFRGDLTIIYGINESSCAFGNAYVSTKKSTVLFATESADSGIVREINSAGMAVITGSSAEVLAAGISKRVRLKGRNISVFAMDPKEDKNLSFALALMAVFEKNEISPENTSLTLEGDEEMLCSMLLVSDVNYGFGYVHAYYGPTVTARSMIRLCPPWEAVSFTPDGAAVENYDCAVIGFGRHGHAALMELIRNGQFAGSTFHATVFAPDYQRQTGKLFALTPGILENYDIQFVSADARSAAFYDYLRQRTTLKLIAVCTGSDTLNREIAECIALWISRKNAAPIQIVLCGKSAVRYQHLLGSDAVYSPGPSPELVSAKSIDRGAIILNSYYDKSSRTAWEKWVSCDTFSKLSSRAAADFQPAFLSAAHATKEELLRGEWRPSETLLNNLAETEHLRWCAFHYTNGYMPMSGAEFEANVKAYMRCKADGVPCSIKVSKNQVARTHACLIPWSKLDVLSERETMLTGNHVDYKQYDINNVLALPELLRAEANEKTL